MKKSSFAIKFFALARGLASVLIALVLVPLQAIAAETGETPPNAGQFTFAWPLGESALRPRGASTRGAPVLLDTAPSVGWQRLREPNLSALERDRRAILAMAGPYRVSFDFLEIMRFDPGIKVDAPYQSWGTEYVFVAEDHGEFIALQHILVMRVQLKDGKISDPIVVRHWRQEWRYQPDALLVYEGASSWTRRNTARDQRRGAWGQSVFQVDDSPRYAALGRWQHSDSFSTWISEETWRPLPRREFSVRSDYDVLVGTNRHTVSPTGWVQEENNLKLVLDTSRKPRAAMPYLGREYGVARYERIKDYDFSAGEQYFQRTEIFWAEVRSAWRALTEREGRFTLRAPVDQGQLFVLFYEYAEKLASGAPFDRGEARAFIERTLRDTYLAGAVDMNRTPSR